MAPPLPYGNYLTVSYLGRKSGSWLWEKNTQWLWDAAEDPKIPQCLRIAHCFTFDVAICTKENRIRLGRACQETHDLLTASMTGTRQIHWKSIGLAIEKTKVDSRCLGIGLSCTSVNDLWQGHPHGKEPWDMFGWLDGLKKEEIIHD